ncbi:YciI family protein [Amycolatopsis thermophila]|uniref:YciI family protein n=1 Tax=Amycolatopsis thermophila TaxID=206084 RepID=UPI0027D8A1CD|nr:YciI family protein [Amycolatopsis thermophila]
MFIVLIDYTAPVEEVDYYLADHAKWLDRHFQSGEFLAAGRRAPHSGCVIVTRPMAQVHLEAVIAANPIVQRHLAQFRIIEFSATRTAPELRLVNEALAV